MTLCAVVAAAALAGCGGDEGKVDDVEAAAQAYKAALIARDGETTCAAVTDDLRRELLSAIRGRVEEAGKRPDRLGLNSCAGTINTADSIGVDQVTADLDAVGATATNGVTVKGGEATITTGGQDWRAQRVEGRWLIACCFSP